VHLESLCSRHSYSATSALFSDRACSAPPPVVPQDHSQESLARHALGEIIERFLQLRLFWKDDIARADPHPELTKFVTVYMNRYINHAIFDIEMTIWVHERKAIIKLRDEEEGK
jgi:hypothetical protein